MYTPIDQPNAFSQIVLVFVLKVLKLFFYSETSLLQSVALIVRSQSPLLLGNYVTNKYLVLD